MIIEIVGGLLSPYDYDEPEILRCSSHAFCPIGVEPGQRTGHVCVAFNIKYQDYLKHIFFASNMTRPVIANCIAIKVLISSYPAFLRKNQFDGANFAGNFQTDSILRMTLCKTRS